MSKIVYVVPGFHGFTKMLRYRRVIAGFRKRNFDVYPIKINWNRRVMSDYVAEFLNQAKKHKKNDQVYIFGFSFGAMISFIGASKINPKALILGSLSPFFREDLKFVKKSWRNYAGKNRMEDFKNFSFAEIIEKNKNQKMYLLVGEREDKASLKKVREVHNKIQKSEMIIVRGARHNLKDKEYLRGVVQIIDKL